MDVIKVNNKEIKFQEVKGKPMIDTRQIAEHFEKLHKDVLRAIDKIAEEEDFNERKIAPVKYKDAKGERRKMYLIDRDIFSLAIMGFTGPKAMQWKRTYIKAFNMMEGELRKQAKQLEAAKRFVPKDGFGEENTKGYIRTQPVRGYWRADTKSEFGKLIQQRYEIAKRLNGLFKEELMMELEIIDAQIKQLKENHEY